MRPCPTCRQPVNWEESEFRPFCSERCQLIDLGRWASEEYRVPLIESADGLMTDFDREFLPEEISLTVNDEQKSSHS